jgi:O-antigen/teichoic acid export membrane protein
MKRENYQHTLTFAYLAMGLAQAFELAYNYLFFLLLPVAQIGLYGWASALFLFFNVIVDMGIEPVLVRKFGQGELRLTQAFRSILLLRIPVILLGFALVGILYKYEILGQEQCFVVLLLGAQVIFNVWDGIFRSWLLANDRQNIVNTVNMVFSGLRLSCIGLMLLFSWNSLYFLLIGILILRLMGSGVFSFLAYASPLANETSPAAAATVGQTAGNLLRAGFSLGGVNLFGILQNRLDWLLVSGMISQLALASYSLANKLYEIIQLFIGVSLRTIYPWLCRDDEERRSSVLVLVRLVILTGSFLGLCGFFLSAALIQALFAAKFAGTELPVRIMMLSVSLIATSGVFYHIALSKGLEAKLLSIIGVATMLQLASNLFLITRFGIVGASLGMLVLAIATLTGFTILVQREKLVATPVIRRIWVFLAASMFYVSLLLYAGVTDWLAALIVLLAVTGTGWLSLFDNEERVYLAGRIGQSAKNLSWRSGISLGTHFR